MTNPPSGVSLWELFEKLEVKQGSEEFWLATKYFCELRLKELYKAQGVFEKQQRTRQKAAATRKATGEL